MHLFNSLPFHRECCTFRNEEYVESGLDELELWYGQTKEECVDSSWDELKHIRQVDWILGHSPKVQSFL